jgi:hypothetical protein
MKAMVAFKTAPMHSLKTPFPAVKTTTQCVSGAFFAPRKGARYLNPQTGLWLSTDPVMGEYVPQAPISDDIRKQNQSLPGMGGVFNTVNLHVYHYAGNNPVKYTDPDGRDIESGTPEKNEQILNALNGFSYYQYQFNNEGKLEKTNAVNMNGSEMFSTGIDLAIEDHSTTIKINWYNSRAELPGDWRSLKETTTVNPRNKLATGNIIQIFLIGDDGVKAKMGDGASREIGMPRKLLHEMIGHAIPLLLAKSWGTSRGVGNAITNENAVIFEMFEPYGFTQDLFILNSSKKLALQTEVTKFPRLTSKTA